MAENHELAGNPTKVVTIDGSDYELEVGNVTYALDALRWQHTLQKVGPDSTADDLEDVAKAGIAIVSSALGDDAATTLMGGRNRLNLVRLVSLVKVIVEESSSEDAMQAMTDAIEDFAETADED